MDQRAVFYFCAGVGPASAAMEWDFTLYFTSGGGGEKRKVIAGLYVHGPRLIALMTFTKRTAPDAMLQQSFCTWSLLPLQSEAKLYMSLLKGSDSE